MRHWGSESDIIQKYDLKKVIPDTWVEGGRQGQQWQSLQCRRQREAAIKTSVNIQSQIFESPISSPKFGTSITSTSNFKCMK